MNFCAVQIFIMLMIVGRAYSLMCFTCSFSDQRRCKRGTGLRTMICPEMETRNESGISSQMCVKIINPNSNDSRKYIRGCEVNVTANGLDFCTNFVNQNKNTKCFSCRTDGCNGCGSFGTYLMWFMVPGVFTLKQILKSFQFNNMIQS